MFIGHFGAAFGAKRVAPQTSLGWLFAASQLPDLLWPVLLLAGVERARVEPGNAGGPTMAFWIAVAVSTAAVVVVEVFMIRRAVPRLVTRYRPAEG
jgi:hypothetical protein